MFELLNGRLRQAMLQALVGMISGGQPLSSGPDGEVRADWGRIAQDAGMPTVTVPAGDRLSRLKEAIQARMASGGNGDAPAPKGGDPKEDGDGGSELALSEFDEGEHPRDEDGKFVEVTTPTHMMGMERGPLAKALVKHVQDAIAKRGDTVRMESLGDVKITTSGAKHTASQAYNVEAAMALTKIHEVLANGAYIGREPDRGETDPNVKGWHRFLTRARVNGVEHELVSRIREASSGKFFYHLDSGAPDAGTSDLRLGESTRVPPSAIGLKELRRLLASGVRLASSRNRSTRATRTGASPPGTPSKPRATPTSPTDGSRRSPRCAATTGAPSRTAGERPTRPSTLSTATRRPRPRVT